MEWSFPRISNPPHHGLLISSNLILTPDTNFIPVEFGWNSVYSVLMPDKFIVTLPEMYTVTCAARKKSLKDFSAASFGTSCTAFCKSIGEKCCT